MKHIIAIAAAAMLISGTAGAADLLEDRLTPADGTQSYGADVISSIDDAELPEVEPGHDWSGFYAGIAVGMGSLNAGNADANYDSVIDLQKPWSGFDLGDIVQGDLENNGLAYGAFAGINQRIDARWIVGLEVGYTRYDFSANTSGSVTSEWDKDGFPGRTQTLTLDAYRSVELEDAITLTPRIGYLMQEQTMLYAKAGAAYGSFSGSGGFDVSKIDAADEFSWDGSMSYADSTNEWGWTVGAGVEHMINERVFIGLDYSFTQFEVSGSADWSMSLTDHQGSYDHSGSSDYERTFGIHTIMARVGARF